MTDLLSATGVGGMPIIASRHLDHGRMLTMDGMILLGTAPLTRAERILRAARHEGRVLARLGRPMPPDPFAGMLPLDDLQVLGPDGRWDWPDLDVELFGAP